MTPEFERVLTLFDRVVHLSDVCAKGVPDDKADWIPIVNPDVRYESRITDVTIRNLYVHLIVSEHHWIRQLRRCADGAEIEIPNEPGLAWRINEGGFRREAMRQGQMSPPNFFDFEPVEMA